MTSANFTTVSGQSLLDVCLNTYGTLEQLSKLIQDNNLITINDPVIDGEIFVWDKDLAVGIQPVLNTYATDNVNNEVEFIEDFRYDTIIDNFNNDII